MRAWLAYGVLIVGLVAGAPVVQADIPPTAPDPGCAGKKAGDLCGARATCQGETCLEYDAAAATSTRYECLQCRPNPDDGGCAVGRSPAVKRAGAWAMAGLFSLLFVFFRRRQR